MSSCFPQATCQGSQAEAPWPKPRSGHCGKTAQPGLGELLERSVPWAPLCKSSNSKLLKLCTPWHCKCCLFLPSSFGFAPSLLYVPGPVTSPHYTHCIDFSQALGDLQEGELCSTDSTCCCTCQRWTTYPNITSCSISRPPHLGDRARPGGSTGWLRVALGHNSQKSVSPHMLFIHLLT